VTAGAPAPPAPGTPPGDEAIAALRRALPPAPADVAVVTARADPWIEPFARAGHRLQLLSPADLAGDDVVATGLAAVVLDRCGAALLPLDEVVAAARRRLAAGGWLVVRDRLANGPAAGPSPSDLVVALAGAGLAVQGPTALGDGGESLWLARRDDYVVRAYREADEAAILDLFRRSFHQERSVEHWRWKYRDDPFGALRISTGWSPAGELVSHYAGYAVPFWYGLDAPARPLLAHQIGDTMTAPGVRHLGRGPSSLLGRTVRHFYARHCAGGVAFNYGFNTANIQKFSLRFVGADRVEPVPYRARDLAAAPLRGAGWRARLRGWRVEPVVDFDPRFSALFAAVRESYGFLAARDAPYLAWRYGRRPDLAYSTYALVDRRRLLGWGVFRQDGERLRWVDALFAPPAAGGLAWFLGGVLARPEHRPTRLVEAWFPSRPAFWNAALEDAGFERRPEPQGLDLMLVSFSELSAATLRAGLYYTMGDGDLA